MPRWQNIQPPELRTSPCTAEFLVKGEQKLPELCLQLCDFALLELDWTFINFWEYEFSLLGVWETTTKTPIRFVFRQGHKNKNISYLGVNMKPYVGQLKIRHSCSCPMTYCVVLYPPFHKWDSLKSTPKLERYIISTTAYNDIKLTRSRCWPKKVPRNPLSMEVLSGQSSQVLTHRPPLLRKNWCRKVGQAWEFHGQAVPTYQRCLLLGTLFFLLYIIYIYISYYIIASLLEFGPNLGVWFYRDYTNCSFTVCFNILQYHTVFTILLPTDTSPPTPIKWKPSLILATASNK